MPGLFLTTDNRQDTTFKKDATSIATKIIGYVYVLWFC